MNYLFLDTEWADSDAQSLVSLALVSADGERELYLEIDPLPPEPKQFALDVVYPLLQRDASAMSAHDLGREIARFLEEETPAAVLADHRNDLHLLRLALGPNTLTRLQGHGLILTCLLKDAGMRALTEAWFASAPELTRLRHHALNDARALRYAWCTVTGRASPRGL